MLTTYTQPFTCFKRNNLTLDQKSGGGHLGQSASWAGGQRTRRRRFLLSGPLVPATMAPCLNSNSKLSTRSRACGKYGMNQPRSGTGL